MKCPLCMKENSYLLEAINKKLLMKQYEKLTKIDFTYLIKEEIKYFECAECSLRFFYPLITGDERFYKSLQNFDWYYVDDKLEYQYAKDYVLAGDVVLDVGSGKGAFSKHVSEKNGEFIGLDFSENAKIMAQENGIDIRLESILDYADKYPESVDVVTSFQVLEHIDDPKSFLEAKLRALKVGGKMIIAVPSEDSFLSTVTNGILNMPPHHVTRWTDDSLRYIAEKYNLDLVNIFHEKVQDIHKNYFLSVLVQKGILKPILLDGSIIRKLVGRFSSCLAKILSNGFTDDLRPAGHNVIAIYKKKETLN